MTKGDKKGYTKPTQKERAPNYKTDTTTINPVIVELVQFLAKKAAESDYQALLMSINAVENKETANDEE